MIETNYNIDLSALTISDLIALSKEVSDEIYARYNEVNINIEELYNNLREDEDYNVLFVKDKIIVDTKREGKLINKEVKVLYKSMFITINMITQTSAAKRDELLLKRKIKILTGGM